MTTIYRNAHGFSPAVAKTAHNGHPVTVTEETRDALTHAFVVECLLDGTTFTAQSSELLDVNERGAAAGSEDSYRLGSDGKFWPEGYNDADTGRPGWRRDPASVGYGLEGRGFR